MTPEDKIKMCRIVGIMLLTDGVLETQEVEFMRVLMDELELDDAQREDVMDRIDASTDVLDDARSLQEHAETLLAVLRSASQVDGVIAPSEADLIDRVADVLDYQPVDDDTPVEGEVDSEDESEDAEA